MSRRGREKDEKDWAEEGANLEDCALAWLPRSEKEELDLSLHASFIL
jgi:hypothetical protein